MVMESAELIKLTSVNSHALRRPSTLGELMKLRTEPKLARRTLSATIDYGLNILFFTWLVRTYGVPKS
jgi:hypothetical protein